MENRLIERFLSYVKIDTQSNEDSTTQPSSVKQFDLAKVVKSELEALKLKDVLLDDNGYLTATLPANIEGKHDVVGFCAHFDTSPDFSGENVKPIIHKNYQGGDIYLNEQTILKPSEFPFLKNHIGDDIITTDGTTLLGADNKAGIAEIIELLHVLIDHPAIPHGEIKIMFTPDEEIGRGTDAVNLDNFKVDYAYTVDGGELGELEYENFNAATMIVNVKGRNIHPGSAKNKMKNALAIGMDFHRLLPLTQAPQYTEGYEGFYHLNDMTGNVEHAQMHYIIRDHDKEAFEYKKDFALKVAELLNNQYDEDTISLEITDSYFNMKEKIEPVMHIIDYAKRAMEAAGVRPLIKPIRGGTDGARLSFMGIPTPNIFTGGYNYHGRYEMIPIQSMERAVAVLVELVQIIAE
ncbi:MULTISPECIES: peptidase T [unclassified Fusibacter]|uniref:peptidase T n=1 Tax=unclassified Fusibacter TaxID=2624464 RepID=UPI001013AD5D|nr:MULTISPECIES: peptidase T [unclassified Fusibacter]MCK8061452.1 peptidase T [Fusibacter sp. A2]NPE23639.1 peptidase T [Fusibacter sp. A1]RXV58912.1 peptidase T [Fusibacter sp. A1]